MPNSFGYFVPFAENDGIKKTYIRDISLFKIAIWAAKLLIYSKGTYLPALAAQTLPFNCVGYMTNVFSWNGQAVGEQLRQLANSTGHPALNCRCIFKIKI